MSMVICKDGKELGIREAVDYLERMYGIPPGDIKGLGLHGAVGQPVTINVTLFWRKENGPAVTETEVTQHGDPDRVFMRSDGTVRRAPRERGRTVEVDLMESTVVIPVADVPHAHRASCHDSIGMIVCGK